MSEIEVLEEVATALSIRKPFEKWGLGEAPQAGLFIAAKSLAENRRHHAEVERLLAEIAQNVRTPLLPGTHLDVTVPIQTSRS